MSPLSLNSLKEIVQITVACRRLLMAVTDSPTLIRQHSYVSFQLNISRTTITNQYIICLMQKTIHLAFLFQKVFQC